MSEIESKESITIELKVSDAAKLLYACGQAVSLMHQAREGDDDVKHFQSSIVMQQLATKLLLVLSKESGEPTFGRARCTYF